MKKYLTTLCFILLMCLQLSAQKVVIDDINFLVDEGSGEESKYENGKLEIMIDHSMSVPTLLLSYYSSTGKEIACKGFTTDASYGYEANEEIVSPLRIRDVYVFKENFSSGREKMLHVCQVTLKPESESFLPMGIYITIFLNDSLYISSMAEFSTSTWNEVTSILKSYQKLLR